MHINFKKFEPLFLDHMKKVSNEAKDVSHDILHVLRVVKVASKLCNLESAKLEVVIPAAYLHDCIHISKKDPQRSKASTISADLSLKLLKSWNYPEEFFEEIHYAIRAHSFSANIKPETLEAKVVQDADRIDALGAIGICRSMAFTGYANRQIYNQDDPFCLNGREPDDNTNTLDHYFIKLLNIAKLACTPSGKQICIQRIEFMKKFLNQLKTEI